MVNFLVQFWPYLVTAIGVVVAVAASAHVVMYKRDSRAATAWAGLIWFAPFFGALLYVTLGINRIRRRGQAVRKAQSRLKVGAASHAEADRSRGAELLDKNPNFEGLVRLVGELAHRPLLAGNHIVPLAGGDAAYPAMLRAIDEAEASITWCTYIFDNDQAGAEFLDALVRAARRGVEVRVLIDDVGARYSRPTMIRQMQTAELTVEGFLPTRVPRLFHYANLRNHRKITVVDGRIGFTGGMNVREGHRLGLGTNHPVEDLHFRLDGPVVGHLQEVFALDWAFASGETLDGELWFPRLSRAGEAFARGIPDGPDEDFETLRLTILGALSAARSKVTVVTPYFLPDSSLITALNVAAMRGVEVDIVLPRQNNIKLVQWASHALLWQLLERGCRLWSSPPPFDHTKLVLVDGVWSLLGSTNWDPRSLRLNFEFNVECYDAQLGRTLTELVELKIAQSEPITFEDVESRSIPIRLRDGTARLMSPYL